MNNQQQQMPQYSYNYNTNNSPRNTYIDNSKFFFSLLNP